MRNIKSFNTWSIVSEATLNDSKVDTVYELSRSGQKAIENVYKGLSENLIFEPINLQPDDDDVILHIRASSFRDLTYGELKEIYNIQIPEKELFIYETSSVMYPYAVALKELKTTMLRQKFREGASARGDYFRETAFIITLARMLWKQLRVKVEISTNRGYIPMEYQEDGDAYPVPQRAEFRNKYWTFMDEPLIGDAMIQQCIGLINRLGESAKRIKSIQKNSVDLTINKFFKICLEKEREKIKNGISNYQVIPDKLVISKWSPADMWISFDRYSWMISDRVEKIEDRFKKLKISDLSDLNDFLSSSIIHKNGIIGVSLKQQLIDAGNVYDVNVERQKKFIHNYQSYQASKNSKSVKLNFSYSLEELGKLLQKDVKKVGEGEIDVRTFSTDIKAPISMEVKGSKTAGHVSGKAGSYIKYVMPPKYYEILTYIQQQSDTQKIKKYMIGKKYEFGKKDLEELFYSDTSSPKTNSSNSRMQAIFFTDWLESLTDTELKDEIVSDIIRFAKSESNWSAPHLLVK